MTDYKILELERDALVLIKDEIIKLKQHLGPEGEYCITRVDKKPMSWESIIVGDIMFNIDNALEILSTRKEIEDAKYAG